MTRRHLLGLPIVLGATPSEPATEDVSNAFAYAYNVWALLRKQAGVVDAREIRAWAATRRAWKKLERTVRY